MILDIIGYIVLGLIVGALARLAVPGRNPMSWWMTLLLGVVGALLGGLVTSAIIGEGHNIIEFIVSVAVAAALVVIYGAMVRRQAV
ncbi:hypothetical protein C3Y87_14280 [Carbonactinospora thermoautotrophica]|uniref:GlsB/YeaQ/YmgE family stress response membrane protein n=1 Tax=Carbonactinospora thermoautotrophica TaxID=1469144 RepID=A0A132MN76_9ACTN|nr:hypothetical protein [Carbonactinospora thermoautotrophica]KWW99306.1 Uncharacterized protein LI90_940 [Carbonactinospora thermoautotrophica]KWX04216.1 hypothetical protein TH66_10100 [Carbonactinospora thermoautotrophica]KWX09375.1 hypothetical protein TR74_09980 [Carbonactinospora thermoautotrophica]MCX9192561.1 hypothetical protein [Carbonactinospora thermoautotrophica]